MSDFDLSLGDVSLGNAGALSSPSSAPADASGSGSSGGWLDTLSAFGASALKQAAGSLFQASQSYPKAYNPTTGAIQATQGNLPSGAAPQVTAAGPIGWIKLHPILAAVLGGGLVVGLFFGFRAALGKK